MNITFLLGNGFDIGIGMLTRYEDFYIKYCEESEDDHENIQLFKEMLRNRNKDEVKRIIDWADFEKAFGEHSTDPSIKDKRAYLDRFEDFIEAFNTYLEKVEACVDYSDTDAIAKVMDNAVQSYYHIRTADKNRISGIINQYGFDRVYNFITFNYTRTVDNCVDAFRQIIKADRNRRVGIVTHIHGYIDQNMIVGVNDENQILNKEFSSDPEIVRELVKPQQNLNSRTAYEDAMVTAINGSHIICTYGMSIGETDKKWWNKISSWLLGNSNRILVILVHEEKYNQRFPHQQDRFIRPILEKFMSFSTLSDVEKKKIESRIFVGVNNDVFKMDLYKGSEEGVIQSQNKRVLDKAISRTVAELIANDSKMDAIDRYNASLPEITVV